MGEFVLNNKNELNSVFDLRCSDAVKCDFKSAHDKLPLLLRATTDSGRFQYGCCKIGDSSSY